MNTAYDARTTIASPRLQPRGVERARHGLAEFDILKRRIASSGETWQLAKHRVMRFVSERKSF